jgi:hypothetical protein
MRLQQLEMPSVMIYLSGEIDQTKDFYRSTGSLPAGWRASFFYNSQQVNSINIQNSGTVSITMSTRHIFTFVTISNTFGIFEVNYLFNC